jgi:dihydrofolate reductase
MAARVRVFIASSIDGFIAGPDDELDWLSVGEGAEDTFTPFMQEVGALLMGRRTYDVVEGFEGDWAYGDTPVLVATSRALSPKMQTVRTIAGSIHEVVAQAQHIAGDKDVYIDGGRLIRQALDADLIDEMTITIIPVVLGAGIPLFAGAAASHRLQLLSHRELGCGLVQLVYRPAARA